RRLCKAGRKPEPGSAQACSKLVRPCLHEPTLAQIAGRGNRSSPQVRAFFMDSAGCFCYMVLP
ncbi:MAG: hypothetical protein NTX06_06040, partial [Proteobacteria bacterium]|nr:hypothetical protein [Pseudomonadota bacterium]